MMVFWPPTVSVDDIYKHLVNVPGDPVILASGVYDDANWPTLLQSMADKIIVFDIEGNIVSVLKNKDGATYDAATVGYSYPKAMLLTKLIGLIEQQLWTQLIAGKLKVFASHTDFATGTQTAAIKGNLDIHSLANAIANGLLQP